MNALTWDLYNVEGVLSGYDTIDELIDYLDEFLPDVSEQMRKAYDIALEHGEVVVTGGPDGLNVYKLEDAPDEQTFLEDMFK